MKIYIATPVNARNEATLEQKRQAAYKRVKELEYKLSKSVCGAEFCEFHSSFDADICPLGGYVYDEPTIMGMCVERVMDCDAILMDKDYEHSKGCNVELFTATTYKKKVLHFYDIV